MREVLFFIFSKASPQKASPAEQAQDPILRAEHGRRHYIQQIMEKIAHFSGSAYCQHRNAEHQHRQQQGTDGNDPYPQDHFLVIFPDAQH